MQDARKIRFERSFKAKKAIDDLQKHVEKLFEIIRISNNINLLNDNQLYSLIISLDKLSKDIHNFYNLFFDTKNTKISKKNPKDNKKIIQKRDEENMIFNKKYHILITLNNSSDKKAKIILKEILSYLKHLFEYNITFLFYNIRDRLSCEGKGEWAYMSPV